MRLSSLFISFFVFVSNYITAQWVEKINPSNHTLYSVDIHESGLCYAGGIGIVKSVDYGNTWTEIVFTGPFAAYFEAVKVNSIEVVDNNTIVAVGWYAFTNRPCIIRTTDNGVNWSVIWEGASGSSLELRDVEFFDHLNGIAVGDQYLLRTTNGGATWTNSSVSGGPYNMKSIKYLTSSIVVVVGDNIILRSNSGGAGYNTQSNGSKYFKSVDYDPLSNTVMAVYQKSPAYDSYTYTSTNLGLAWTSNQIHTDQIFSMELLTNDTLFLGYDESFRISFNDGVDDFIFDDYPFELVHDISFTNNTGLCVMGLWTDCKIFKYDYSLPLSITQNVDFSVEDSICTNSITSYAPTNSSLDSCHWFVDNVFMSNLYNFDYLHSNPGINEVKLVSYYNGITDTVIKFINVLDIPVVDPFIFNGNLSSCAGVDYFFTVENIAGQSGFKVYKNGVPINFYSSSGNDRTYKILASSSWPQTIQIVKWLINECDSISLTETYIINQEVLTDANQDFFLQDSLICKGDNNQIVIPEPDSSFNYNLYQNGILISSSMAPTSDTLIFNLTNILDEHIYTLKTISPIGACLTNLSHVEQVQIDSALASFDAGLGYFLEDSLIDLDISNSVGNIFSWSTNGSLSTGINMNTSSPSIAFDTTGYFDVNLTIQSSTLGCVDSSSKSVVIFNLANEISDYSVCFAEEKNLPFMTLDNHIDNFGNIISVGYNMVIPSSPYPRYGATIKKYDSDGVLLWEWQYQCPNTIQDQHHNSMFGSVTTDANGNIYVQGGVFGKQFSYQNNVLIDQLTGLTPSKAFLIKLTPDGDFVWWININRTSNGGVTDVAYDTRTNHLFFSLNDCSGDLILPSGIYDSFPNHYFKIIEIDTSGSFIDFYPAAITSKGIIKPFTGSGTWGVTISPEIFIGTDSLIYISGELEDDDSGTFGSYALDADPIKHSSFIAKLNVDSTLGPVGWIDAKITARFYPSPMWWDTPVVSHTMDEANNIYQSINWDIGPHVNGFSEIGIDSIYPNNGLKGSNIFCFDKNLNYMWQKSFEPVYIRDIQFVDSNHIYFTGMMNEHFVSFDGDSIPDFLMQYNYDDNVFVGSLDDEGEINWFNQIGQGNYEFAFPIAANSCGDVVFSGYSGFAPPGPYSGLPQNIDFELNNINYGVFNARYMYKITDSFCASGGCGTFCNNPIYIPNPTILSTDTSLFVLDYYSSYQWFLNGDSIPGATNATYNFQSNGNYELFVEDLNGCSNLISYSPSCLINNLISPQIFIDSLTLVVADTFDIYTWFFNQNEIINLNNHELDLSLNGNGFYYVVVSDSFNCVISSDSLNINWLSTLNYNLNSTISVYPNPFQDKLNLVIPSSFVIDKIVIKTINGKEIYCTTQTTPIEKIELDLEFLAPGYYIIEIFSVVENNRFLIVKV